ncbi:MAG TPA: hypothetical protein VMU05_09960 [Dongiaceae bacterium]|nr:hypothetical protein [Dongiaceae bacterium]
MLRTNRAACTIAALTILALFFLACGDSSSHNLSQAQVQAISQQMSSALGSAFVAQVVAVNPATAATSPSLARAMQQIQPDAGAASGCTITPTGQSCDITIAYTGNCPKGGTISVSGDLAYTLDNSGNGSDKSTVTITPASCAVQDVTFSGNPNVSVAIQVGFQNNAIAYPMTFSESGGITYGPHPSGSCSVKVNATVTSPTACTITGSICGRSISGSC